MIVFENLNEYEIYRSEACSRSVFAVRVVDLKVNQSCKVELFEVLDNGESYLDIEPISETFIYGKYYLPHFLSEKYKWSHNANGSNNKHEAFSDARNFALDYGFKKAEITPY